jgi:hypothetical protein
MISPEGWRPYREGIIGLSLGFQPQGRTKKAYRPERGAEWLPEEGR